MESEAFGSEAESLFAELVAGDERELEARLEALCRARPELADALREVHAGWRLAERARRDVGLGRSVAHAHGLDAAGAPRPTRAVAREPDERLAGLAERARGARRLELGAELGRGGMGQVLEARDPDLGRTLALKRIRADRLPAKEAGESELRAHLLHRFLAEAQVTAQLEHPGVVPVHDVGLDERGEPFYTMARIEGEDLGRVLEKARAGTDGWSVPRAVEVLVRVCETLAYAHEQGVVHRDVKPQNVRVGRLGQVYVTDWGLARVRGAAPESPAPVATDRQREIEEGSPLATREGLVPGTPEYMAPEQAAGRAAEVGPRTDVYALGALVYELCSGRAPHPRGDSTPEELRLRAASEPPAPLARIAPDAPPELVAIAEKAMAREPAERYATALELAADLRAWLEGRVVRAHRTGAWVELVKWTRRNRLAAAALTAALVLLVAGLATALALGAKEREAARLAERRRLDAEASQRLAEERTREADAQRAEATAQAKRARDEAARAESAEREVRERLAKSQVDRAELARARGRWSEVLESLAAARESGWPDEVELELREAQALRALGRHEEARGLLDGLLARDDLGAQRGRALLETGSLAIEEYEDQTSALALLREALELGLPPADAAYARGLLAPTVPEALRELRTAIALEPFHHGARTAALVLLVLGGIWDEALEDARTLRAFYPEDPMPDLTEVFAYTALERDAEADEALARARERLGPEQLGGLEFLVELMRTGRDALGVAALIGSAGEPGLDAERRVQQLHARHADDVVDVMRAFRAPNLPAISSSWGETFQGILTMIGLDNLLGNAMQMFGKKQKPAPADDKLQRARPHFARAWEANPDGLFSWLEAGAVMNDPTRLGPDESKLREAEELYRRASRSRSILPGVPRASRLWATLCQLAVAELSGDREMLARGEEGLRSFLALPDLLEAERVWLATFASKAGAAEYVLVLQRLGPPEDAEGLRREARLFELIGDEPNALEAWKAVLALEPDAADARERVEAAAAGAGR